MRIPGSPLHIRPRIHQNLVFHHIPKCGGTSIRHAIAHHYAHAAAVHLDAPASWAASQLLGKNLDRYREEILLYLLARPDLRYVSGHFAFSKLAYETFGDRWEFVTILREPISRWFSHYFFNRFRTDDHFKIHDDLEAFVDSDPANRLGCFYVDKFAPEWVGEPAPSAVSAAKENLAKFAVVGCLERFGSFVSEFRRLYSVKLATGHSMRGPVDKEKREHQITDETRRKVEAICQPDIEGYRYALARSGPS